jgi:hypothetical protein
MPRILLAVGEPVPARVCTPAPYDAATYRALRAVGAEPDENVPAWFLNASPGRCELLVVLSSGKQLDIAKQ